MVKKNPRTTRKELVGEMSFLGVNVNKQTMTNTLTSEGLLNYQARKVILLNESHPEACRKLAADMLKKEDSYFDKILWSNETKSYQVVTKVLSNF